MKENIVKNFIAQEPPDFHTIRLTLISAKIRLMRVITENIDCFYYLIFQRDLTCLACNTLTRVVVSSPRVELILFSFDVDWRLKGHTEAVDKRMI